MFRTYLCAAIMVLVPVGAGWSKSNPEQEARDAYAQEITIAAEHNGWDGITISAAKPNAMYGRRGNHDALRIEAKQTLLGPYMKLDSWNVQTVDRFIAQEITPRRDRLRDLGFVQVDIVGLPISHSYPAGQVSMKLEK